MSQPASGHRPLFLAGALGLLAGALVAQQLAGPSALAADPTPTPISGAATASGKASGIVFLDSRTGTAVADSPRAPLAPGTAPAAALPAQPQNTPDSGGFVRVVMMLTVLIGGAVAWFFMRRRQLAKGGGTTKSLALIGTVKIAGRWQVALVKVPGKTLVLGATDKGLSLLSELDDELELGQDETEHDELVKRIRDDDTVAFTSADPRAGAASPRGPTGHRPTDPLGLRSAHTTLSPGARPITGRAPEPFDRLLDQLTRGTADTTPPGPSRERLKTDEALALRARLERHQPTN